MRALNNNVLKALLISQISNIANLKSFRECTAVGDHLETSNFEVIVITNRDIAIDSAIDGYSIEHKFLFDYNCNLICLTHGGNLTKLTDSAFKLLSKICKLSQGIAEQN